MAKKKTEPHFSETDTTKKKPNSQDALKVTKKAASASASKAVSVDFSEAQKAPAKVTKKAASASASKAVSESKKEASKIAKKDTSSSASEVKKEVSKVTKKAASSSASETKKETSKTTKKDASSSASETKKETSKTTKKAAPKKSSAKARINVKEPLKLLATKASKESKTEKINVDKKALRRTKKIALKLLATPAKDLKSGIFNLKEKYQQAIFDSILAERASRRQGTHKAKNRAEVSGTGKKPFPQKGTGRARAGTLRAPHHVGGGVARTITNDKNYALKVNKKVKKLALKASLSNLASLERVLVDDDFKMETISTKNLLSKLAQFNAQNLKRILIVSDDHNLFLSARNLPNVKVTKVQSLLVEDLNMTNLLILSQNDVKTLEGVLK